MHNQKNLTPLCLNWKVSILSSLVILIYIFRAIRSTGTIQNFWILTVYCTVSIKRPHLNFFQKSLLNVRYDRKNEGLNILSTRSYNRVVRVSLFQSKGVDYAHHIIMYSLLFWNSGGPLSWLNTYLLMYVVHSNYSKSVAMLKKRIRRSDQMGGNRQKTLNIDNR